MKLYFKLVRQFFQDELNKNSVSIIMKKEEESFQKNYEHLPWTKFKVGRKQIINIQAYLKKCIEQRIYNALFFKDVK